jgi:hypothetical protein
MLAILILNSFGKHLASHVSIQIYLKQLTMKYLEASALQLKDLEFKKIFKNNNNNINNNEAQIFLFMSKLESS